MSKDIFFIIVTCFLDPENRLLLLLFIFQFRQPIFKWGKGDIPRKPWRNLNKLPKRNSVSSFLEFLSTSDLVMFATLVLLESWLAGRCWLVDLIWMIVIRYELSKQQWNPLASNTYESDSDVFLGVFHETIQENIFGKITKVLQISWSRCQRAMIGGSMLYLDLQHAAGTLNGCFRCGNVSVTGSYLGCTLW